MQLLFATVLALALLGQAERPPIQNVYTSAGAGFRDDANRSWIAIDLDPTSETFGKFGLYRFDAPDQMATVSYFGVSAPVQLGNGRFAFDQVLDVQVKERVQNVDMAAVAADPFGDYSAVMGPSHDGTLHIVGELDTERHTAALSASAGEDVIALEMAEPDLSGAWERADAALAAWVAEDWAALYGMAMVGVRSQATEEQFVAEMTARTPEGPASTYIGSVPLTVEVRTPLGFLEFRQRTHIVVRAASGRLLEGERVVRLIREDGEWRLADIANDA
jgi:hypothetical protein